MLNKLKLILEEYGLETVLSQNDITELDVLALLFENGMMSIDDYFYLNEEELDDED